MTKTKKDLPEKNFQLCVKGMATAGKAARNRQQVFYTDLTKFDLLIGQGTITCTLSRLMRTVKDAISLGDCVSLFTQHTLLAGRVLSPEAGVLSRSDTPRSWDRHTEYFGQQLSPYRPCWTSHRCTNRDFGANKVNKVKVWELPALLLRLWASQNLLIRLACPHVQHVHCLVV